VSRIISSALIIPTAPTICALRGELGIERDALSTAFNFFMNVDVVGAEAAAVAEADRAN
jgi:hypothetical protein